MSLNYNPIFEVWGKAAEYLLSPPKGIQLPWWPKFNEFTGGLRSHELTLLCAPTGAGKTQLLANISAQLVLQNEPHFVAPVETGDSDFVIRLISCLERRDLNTGNAEGFGYVQSLTTKYAESVLKKNVFIATYDNRVEIEEMVNLLTYMHQNYGCTVALLDNLNFFLNVVSSQMEKAEMDSAVHQLVMLVKKIPMHVILVVHPKKTEGGRVLSEFDIKGSSTAVQEASNVLLFNRPSDELIEKRDAYPTDREMVFRKIRKRGMYVGRPIWLAFESGRYQEIKK